MDMRCSVHKRFNRAETACVRERREREAQRNNAGRVGTSRLGTPTYGLGNGTSYDMVFKTVWQD